MFCASFPAGPWQTNCYVLATAVGEECVVVDPGMDSLPGVADVVAEHRLKPTAAVLTHGHLDHMFSVTPLCASYASTCWVHPGDRHLLADPLAGMSADTRQLLVSLTGRVASFTEPDAVAELADRVSVEVAGLTLLARHAPGHTAGSVVFELPGGAGDTGVLGDAEGVVLSGDVLFAGSIGRTDLPGGDPAAMRATLRDVVWPLPDAAVVLPGHGPRTTIARERATNPYLRQAAA